MASTAAEDAHSAALDAISKPPPGVVLPPKEIRTILEKTAGYVARNGVAFEERIRQKEAANPKFCFLTETDPYYPFYEWRLNEVRSGRGSAVSAGRDVADGPGMAQKPKGPEPPPEFHFSARMPNISAMDLDVVKLTAFFVAKNGRSFTTTLSQREASNYQFDFLRPQHSLFQFFSRLVDQYRELLNIDGTDAAKAERARVEVLRQNVKDKFHILGGAKQRAQWVQHKEKQKQQKEEEEEAEKVAYAQIDWHDFVVVETVLFNEADDASALPPPTSLSDLQSASLEQKAAMSLQPNHMRIEEAMPGEEMYNHAPPPPPEPYLQRGLPAYLPPPPFYPGAPSPAPRTSNSPMPPPSASPMPLPSRSPPPSTSSPAPDAQPARPSANAPMKIRSDYVPRAQANRRIAATAICPNCKQSFPVDELEEHMRIELLDPRWREQKAKSEARYSTTNLSTAEVANNLKRLASQRTDIFDSKSGEPISEEESARRKRAAMSYDGVIQGVNNQGDAATGLTARHAAAGKAALQAQAREKAAAGRSIEEQLRHIQEKARSTQ